MLKCYLHGYKNVKSVVQSLKYEYIIHLYLMISWCAQHPLLTNDRLYILYYITYTETFPERIICNI